MGRIDSNNTVAVIDKKKNVVIKPNKLSLSLEIEKTLIILDILSRFQNSHHIISSIYNALETYDYNETPKDLRSEKRNEANTTISSGLVVFLFAIFESYFKQSEWKTLGDKLLVSKIKAYKHVRHSFAHFIDGSRAMKYKELADEFEKVMESEDKLSITFQDNKIFADTTSVYELTNLLYTASQQLISRRKSATSKSKNE